MNSKETVDRSWSAALPHDSDSEKKAIDCTDVQCDSKGQPPCDRQRKYSNPNSNNRHCLQIAGIL